MGFSQLVDHIDKVMLQGDSGVRVVNIVNTFFDKHLQVLQRYANDMSAVVNEAKANLSTMPVQDHMESCWKMWNAFFEQMGNFVNVNHALVRDVNSDIYFPSSKCHEASVKQSQENRVQIDAIMEVMRLASGNIAAEQAELEKHLTDFTKLKKSSKKKKKQKMGSQESANAG